MNSVVNIIWWLLLIAVLGPPMIVFAYLSTRAASVAYFKTKLEHFRSVRAELVKGETDGV